MAFRCRAPGMPDLEGTMKKKTCGWIVCFVLALMCSGQALLLAGPATAPEAMVGDRLNVPQLIAKMHQDGEIDYSMSLRLKILWFKKWDMLPQRFKEHFDVPVGCATPVIMEIVDNFHHLTEADRKWLADEAGLSDLATIGGRPAFALTLQSSVIPLRVHYENSSQQSKAERTLAAYEHSWQVECNEMGFFTPPGDYGMEGSDDYDVYLSTTQPGVLGYTSPETQVAETWWNDKTSHIVNSNDLNSDREIQTVSSHEFNHCCQMSMAAETITSFYENTAVWVEPHVYPEWSDDAWGYSMWYQRDPWRPVSGFDNDGIGLYQYGGFLWPEFFCERIDQWDSTVIREIWDYCRDEPGSNDINVFDGLVHFANQYSPGGPDGGGEWTIYNLITEFCEWRYICGQYMDDGQHYTYGEEFAQARVDAEHRHTELPAVCPDDLPNAPEFFGVNYIRFDEAITNQTDLTIFFSGEEEHNGTRMIWKLAIIKVYELGGAFSYEVFDVPQETQTLWLNVDQVDQCERLLMVVANLGAGYTNPGQTFPSKNYTYVAWPEADPNTSMIVVGPGPGQNNPPTFRTFLSGSDVQFSERIHFGAYGYGLNVATGDIDGDGITEVMCGPGPDPLAPPRIRGYELNGDLVLGTNVYAYGVDKYGVNVACGDIDGDGVDETVSGPGPGQMFGPQVRGFKYDAEDGHNPIPAVNFFAYGTLKFGVNVSCGDIDGDGIDEIVTGAGPGAVFGPHVRGWNYDGGSRTTPIPGVSYLAYGTPKWGVNVACGDIDGDGIDEIITGAGPGAVYGPHVRGWNYDGGTLAAIPGVSFLAYGTNKFGVNVTCGDVDEDGIDEIVTGAGPGEVFGSHVRGWNYDGGTIDSIAAINFFAYPYSGEERVRHGANVAVGNLVP